MVVSAARRAPCRPPARPPTAPACAPPPMVDLLEPIPFEPPRRRTRVKKLRVLVVAVPLGMLALVSTVFGMMMAVAADVNGLDTSQIFRVAHSSRLTDVHGQPLGILSEQNRVVVPLNRVSVAVQNAVVAVEDKRFYEKGGVAARGAARAFRAALVSGKPAQGGSTIPHQFVKNRLEAQNDRTV